MATSGACAAALYSGGYVARHVSGAPGPDRPLQMPGVVGPSVPRKNGGANTLMLPCSTAAASARGSSAADGAYSG